MCPHVESDTRRSSKTLVRHTAKACLKVLFDLIRNEATVRAGTAKDVSRAVTSQFRDISRAMHVRSQMTLNARKVDEVLGFLTRNAHIHLLRFSSISCTDFVSLLENVIENILGPTETVTARNTGTTITTNDTSSGAASSLSASQSRTAMQSNALLRIARTTRSSRIFSYNSSNSCWKYKRLSWLWTRMETRLASGVINRWIFFLILSKAIGATFCLSAKAAGHVF